MRDNKIITKHFVVFFVPTYIFFYNILKNNVFDNFHPSNFKQNSLCKKNIYEELQYIKEIYNL